VSEGWPSKKKNRAATPERLFFQTFPRLDHVELFGEPFEINILLYDALIADHEIPTEQLPPGRASGEPQILPARLQLTPNPQNQRPLSDRCSHVDLSRYSFGFFNRSGL
jgi:hypothetical protein